jgi:glycine cleavage system H protein
VVVSHNERLDRNPELLNQDPYGEGWMVVVRPSGDDWRDKLVDGASIRPAFEAWIETGSYKDRSG